MQKKNLTKQKSVGSSCCSCFTFSRYTFGKDQNKKKRKKRLNEKASR